MSEQINPGTFVEDDEISLLDLLTVIVENLKLLILGPLVAGLIALGYSFLITPTFTAKTTMIPPGQSSGGGTAALLGQLGGLGALAGGAAGIKTPTDQYLAYLESNTLRDELIEKFKLRDRYKAKYQESARDTLKGSVKATADKKSGLITIEVSDKDPNFAADLANAYVQALSHLIGELALKEAKVKRELLEKQIIEAMQKSYQSPMVREAVIQSLIREYEAARLDERKENPFLAQVDVAEVPCCGDDFSNRILVVVVCIYSQCLA
jgi:tyrosine-protein kinase Etk/Wzc